MIVGEKKPIGFRVPPEREDEPRGEAFIERLRRIAEGKPPEDEKPPRPEAAFTRKWHETAGLPGCRRSWK